MPPYRDYPNNDTIYHDIDNSRIMIPYTTRHYHNNDTICHHIDITIIIVPYATI